VGLERGPLSLVNNLRSYLEEIVAAPGLDMQKKQILTLHVLELRLGDPGRRQSLYRLSYLASVLTNEDK
jgi:hypothetical protein